jgi:hypothetical protein
VDVTEIRQRLSVEEDTMTASVLDTPERVMTVAMEGRLSKHALASLLTSGARRAFYDACGRIELKYTEECRALNDPCLASGCSAEGERCLQPILRAGVDYYKACGTEWARLFASERNRDNAWKATVAEYNADV